MQTKLHQLSGLGQSIWLDYINRHMIESGKLRQWIDNGLRGMTSNPSIFNQVISQMKDYDEKILRLKEAGKSTFEIYDELTIADIQDACRAFQPIYEQTKYLDGYVSLEINPKLANDTKASIQEGLRLFERVNRPNVMIKVPATDAGFPVIEELLANGVNVNVTLIFSQAQYLETVRAFLRGLKRLAKTTDDLSRVRSVASVFVSRIDTLIDKVLEEKAAKIGEATRQEELRFLKGKAAVANSVMIFWLFKELFGGEEFKTLAGKGAAVQRVLWGSTSTKNPDYRDVKYVEELIANPTVNTVPEKTLEAFMDHGQVKLALTDDDAGKIQQKAAQTILNTLRTYDIKIEEVCGKLLDEGVVAFEKAFEELMQSIETKARQLVSK